eukprot:4220550-Heterocapsa_arctica.AAC.1
MSHLCVKLHPSCSSLPYFASSAAQVLKAATHASTAINVEHVVDGNPMISEESIYVTIRQRGLTPRSAGQ